MATHSHRSLKRTASSVTKTAVVWALAGAVFVPLLSRNFDASSDQASAVLAIFLGVSTTALSLLVFGLKKLVKAAPAPEVEIPAHVNLRTWILVAITLTSVLAGTFALSALVSYVFVSQLAGLEWAQEILGVWGLRLLVVALAGPILVPTAAVVSQAIRQLDGMFVLVGMRIHRVVLISAVLLVSQLSVITGHTVGNRHHWPMSRHAA